MPTSSPLPLAEGLQPAVMDGRGASVGRNPTGALLQFVDQPRRSGPVMVGNLQKPRRGCGLDLSPDQQALSNERVVDGPDDGGVFHGRPCPTAGLPRHLAGLGLSAMGANPDALHLQHEGPEQ